MSLDNKKMKSSYYVLFFEWTFQVLISYYLYEKCIEIFYNTSRARPLIKDGKLKKTCIINYKLKITRK